MPKQKFISLKTLEKFVKIVHFCWRSVKDNFYCWKYCFSQKQSWFEREKRMAQQLPSFSLNRSQRMLLVTYTLRIVEHYEEKTPSQQMYTERGTLKHWSHIRMSVFPFFSVYSAVNKYEGETKLNDYAFVCVAIL